MDKNLASNALRAVSAPPRPNSTAEPRPAGGKAVRGEYSYIPERRRTTLPYQSAPPPPASGARGVHAGAPDPMLTDQLRLFGWVGSAGDATVWLAEHLGLEMPVIVKLLPREFARHREALEQFKREATTLARLRTPHVVQVFDHGITPSGAAYIVMELLEGETVESALRARCPLPLAHAVEIVRQTGRVLAKAADLGIRCRDIQPHKLFLVDGEGGPFVKLTDFTAEPGGDARQIDEANVPALGDLAWRCFTSAPSMPEPIEDWLACAALPAGDGAFASVRELLSELDTAILNAG